jgi:hypothetical protein
MKKRGYQNSEYDLKNAKTKILELNQELLK